MLCSRPMNLPPGVIEAPTKVRINSYSTDQTGRLWMNGPADLDFTVYGVDLLASRTLAVWRRAVVSPYVGVSTYLSTSHEKTAAVTLDDERVLAAQAMVGAAVQLSMARLGVEYNVAKVHSLSLKVGIGR